MLLSKTEVIADDLFSNGKRVVLFGGQEHNLVRIIIVPSRVQNGSVRTQEKVG